jgi:cytochrome c peroxidase
MGTRNAPSLLALAEDQPIFWDGRRSHLSEGVVDPFVNAVEMGLSSTNELESRLRVSKTTPSGERLSEADVARALTAYVRGLSSPETLFERLSREHGANASFAKAQYGETLFNGRAGCSSCHASGGSKPLYSDHKFHASGTGLRNVEGHLPALISRIMASGSDPRSVGSLVATDADTATLGRFVSTHAGNDVGRFRTPALRYVANTGPYMHDGTIPTLEAAVDQEVYWRGLASGVPIALTVSERDAIVAFLKTLRLGAPYCSPSKPLTKPLTKG